MIIIKILARNILLIYSLEAATQEKGVNKKNVERKWNQLNTNTMRYGAVEG